MAPLAIGSVLLGGIQTGVALNQLNKLNKEPAPNYSISPQLQNSYSRSLTRSGYGFAPEIRTDYFNNMAGRYAQNFRNATQVSGGNQSQAIGRALQSGQLRDFSNFAAQDAQAQERNIRYNDQVGAQLTNQQNLITGQNINYRMQREQAWGGALQSGLNNLAGAANFFAMNGGFKPNQPSYNGQQSFAPAQSFNTPQNIPVAPQMAAPNPWMPQVANNSIPYAGQQFAGGISPYGSINPWE